MHHFKPSEYLLRRIMNRRLLLKSAATLLTLPALPALAKVKPDTDSLTNKIFKETHGLSSFGELALAPDFEHFAYVNPQAPKGGSLILQIRQLTGNQNFDTFNTFNIFSFSGDGAAGIDMVFDTLMVSNLDEPTSMYGLLAQSVFISDDSLTYKFKLRPEARFHNGEKVTAQDVAFSLNLMKEKGHFLYRQLLKHMEKTYAEHDDLCIVRLAPERGRDLHLIIASMPIFSQKFWQNKDFEAITLERPIGSGAYQVGKFEPGQYIEFDRVKDYWAAELPINKGLNNFDTIRYEYFRDRMVGFEAFRSGRINYHEEFTSRIWAMEYDIPPVKSGRIIKEELVNSGAVPIQAWHFNTRLDKFKDIRIRKALGMAFDFEWVNQHIMYGSYERIQSYFQNTNMEAKGLPSQEELDFLEQYRSSLSPEVFGEPVSPPRSDSSGLDRSLMRQAMNLLQEAGCTRKGAILFLPDGQPFTIEFLDFQTSMQPHVQAFQKNLKALGITATSRIVDASQFRARLRNYDFEMISGALSGSLTPGDSLANVYGSEAAKTPNSRNYAGVSDSVIDTLLKKIAAIKSRKELDFYCRILDRILRANYYWVPMWYKATYWLAYWDEFSRPETKPVFSSGAPSTWWWDSEKAKKTARTG